MMNTMRLWRVERVINGERTWLTIKAPSMREAARMADDHQAEAHKESGRARNPWTRPRRKRKRKRESRK